MSQLTKLAIVRLLEPELCLECRFAKIADVAGQDGVLQRMIYCTRLDCDNRDHSDFERPTSACTEDGREI